MVPIQAEYLSNGRSQPCDAYTSVHARKPGPSVSTISPSKSNISASTRLLEPKRLLDLAVVHRTHAATIEAPLVHVLIRPDDANTRGTQECLRPWIGVRFRRASLEGTEKAVEMDWNKCL